MSFNTYIDNLISEKGIDLEAVIEVEGDMGANQIPVGVLVDAMKSAPAHEQAGIRDMLVRIDFKNGDVMDYFRHLAKAIAL